MTAAVLSSEDKEYLAQCEEQFKDRYTEKDEEFMKVHNAESLTPPIMETWWVPHNSGRRNDRRFNRRSHPYDRHDRRSDHNNERRSDHDNERRSDHDNERRSDHDNDRAHGHRNRRYY